MHAFDAIFIVDVVIVLHLLAFPSICCVVDPTVHPAVYPTATAASYSVGTVAATGALWDMIRDSGTGAGDVVREVSQVRGRFDSLVAYVAFTPQLPVPRRHVQHSNSVHVTTWSILEVLGTCSHADMVSILL